jgi:hypothetical protein
MVDEAGVIAPSPLPDLIYARRSAALHDIDISEASGDEADKFADGSTSLKRLYDTLLA